jgi:hypothetical protein
MPNEYRGIRLEIGASGYNKPEAPGYVRGEWGKRPSSPPDGALYVLRLPGADTEDHLYRYNGTSVLWGLLGFIAKKPDTWNYRAPSYQSGVESVVVEWTEKTLPPQYKEELRFRWLDPAIRDGLLTIESTKTPIHNQLAVRNGSVRPPASQSDLMRYDGYKRQWEYVRKISIGESRKPAAPKVIQEERAEFYVKSVESRRRDDGSLVQELFVRTGKTDVIIDPDARELQQRRDVAKDVKDVETLDVPEEEPETAVDVPGGWLAAGYVLPEDLDFERWSSLGRTLQKMDRGIQWWLGDWWNYGEDHYGEKAAQAVEENPALERSTIRNYAWVCRRFKLEQRRPGVSFAHHYTVAKLMYDYPEVAQELLRRTQLAKLNRIVLREMARLCTAIIKERFPQNKNLANSLAKEIVTTAAERYGAALPPAKKDVQQVIDDLTGVSITKNGTDLVPPPPPKVDRVLGNGVLLSLGSISFKAMTPRNPETILVSGSRGITSDLAVRQALFSMLREALGDAPEGPLADDERYIRQCIKRLLHGGARGVDTLAANWARAIGLDQENIVKVEPSYSDFDALLAPKFRNMNTTYEADRVFVVWDGLSGGTAHTIAWATAFGKPVHMRVLSGKLQFPDRPTVTQRW